MKSDSVAAAMLSQTCRSSEQLPAAKGIYDSCAIRPTEQHVVAVGGMPSQIAQAILVCAAIKLHWYSWNDAMDIAKENPYFIPLYEIVFHAKFTVA